MKNWLFVITLIITFFGLVNSKSPEILCCAAKFLDRNLIDNFNSEITYNSVTGCCSTQGKQTCFNKTLKEDIRKHTF